MIKLLHTADLHFGIKFLGFGEKGKELRQAVQEVLKRIVDLALRENVDLVLMAGDLFDSNTVSKKLVDYAISELKRLGDIPVCILPGTHDSYDRSSVYRRVEFQDVSNIHIFTDKPHMPHSNTKDNGENPPSPPLIKGGKGGFLDETNSIIFPELDLTIYGRANLANTGSDSPISGLIKSDETKYHVAMAHGEIAIEGKYAGDYYPIELKDIAESKMDYIALGHWHRLMDFSQGDVKAFYCGVPETLSFDEREDSGCVLLVELDDSVVNVKKERVGKYVWKTLNLDVEDYDSDDELISEISKSSDTDVLLRVNIGGVQRLEIDFDEEHIAGGLEDKFFHVEIRWDDLKIVPDSLSLDAYPETTVPGQFLRLMLKRIEESDETEKPVLQEALHLGFALLKGKEVSHQ